MLFEKRFWQACGGSAISAMHPRFGCRRTFVTPRNNAGAHIRAIQQALKHSMAETTFKYLFLSDAQTKMMADYASLPPPSSPATVQPVRPVVG